MRIPATGVKLVATFALWKVAGRERLQSESLAKSRLSRHFVRERGPSHMGLRRLPRGTLCVGAAHLALNSYILFRRVVSVTSVALIPINVFLRAFMLVSDFTFKPPVVLDLINGQLILRWSSH